MKQHQPSILFSFHAQLVLAASLWTGNAMAEQEPAQTPIDSMQVVCAPDRPLVHPGDSVRVNVWVTDQSGGPIVSHVQFDWKSSLGDIAGNESATWSFTEIGVESGPPVKATATVTVHRDSVTSGPCQVAVYVAKPQPVEPSGPDRSGTQHPSTFTLGARAFLLPTDTEANGYGLYSYLLFDSPPNSEQSRKRDLSAIEAYLRILPSTEEMAHYRRQSQLNIVILPVRYATTLPADLLDSSQSERAAQDLLQAYDFARAKVVLANFGITQIGGGPYLISKLPNDSQGQQLLFDMGHVEPKLVWDWVTAFCSLTAQEQTWTNVTLSKLALNTRNVIAVGARETPGTVSNLKDWIKVAKNLGK